MAVRLRVLCDECVSVLRGECVGKVRVLYKKVRAPDSPKRAEKLTGSTRIPLVFTYL